MKKKIGDDKKGRQHIVDVINALKGEDGDAFFGGEAPGRAWVATSGEYDGEWFKPGFDDSAWTVGKNGAGYEHDKGYESLISSDFDFEKQMYGKATSLYLRFPFEIDDLKKINSAAKLFCE